MASADSCRVGAVVSFCVVGGRWSSICPRDTDIEVTAPSYRVYFWERLGSQGDTDSGFRSEEYEIADAQDVREVLGWAEAQTSNGRSCTVYAVVDRTLVRLCGQDPTAAG